MHARQIEYDSTRMLCPLEIFCIVDKYAALHLIYQKFAGAGAGLTENKRHT
jgi:hypothetical protein